MGFNTVPWSKNKQKYLSSLRNSKFRKIHDRYVIEGNKIATEFLKDYPEEVDSVIATQNWLEKCPQNIDLTIDAYVLKQSDFKGISAFKTPPEVIIVAKKSLKSLKELVKPVFRAVYLDDVQDPGNVGSIIRSACWFGYDAVIRSHGSADFYNPKVIQSTMGGFMNIGLVNDSLSDIRSDFSEINLIGTSLNAESIFNSIELPKQFAIVIGNEGKGMSLETQSLLHQSFQIPGSDRIESLNASVAFGIVASRFAQL